MLYRKYLAMAIVGVSLAGCAASVKKMQDAQPVKVGEDATITRR